MAIDLVGLDGDDTLWHSERHFVVTEQRVADLLAPYASAAAVSEQLLAHERANLRLYGYGVKGFLLSLVETAITLSDGAIRGSDLRQVLDWGKEMLEHPVELLDGVAATVAALGGRYRLVLITKGDLFHQESKVAGSGLADHFSGVEIVSEKGLDDYRQILRRYDTDPARFVMVGNSLRSDVLPAAELGGYGVYVPYHITWAMEHAELPDALAERVRHLEDFSQLPAVLDALAGSPG